MPDLAVVQGLTERLADHPLAALAAMFGAGILTSLTPCIYPMIPVTAGIVAGSGTERTPFVRRLGLTLTYVVGLALFYAVLGLVAGLTGSLFGTVASNPWVRLATGTLFLVFGLALLDVIPVAAPERLARWAGRLSGGSYPAVFALGATSGIVAAPCGAPAFAAVLTWVGTTGSAAWGFIYLFVFSLGMTALLVAVGLSSGAVAILPRSGRWMEWIKRAAGLLLIGVAVYYFMQIWNTL